MAENSRIQWTHHTFNPWIGCTKVSEACKFCYAEKLTHRWHYEWGPQAERKKTSFEYWKQPLRWNEKAKNEGVRYRVFCASLADIFDDHESIKQEWRDELWRLIKITPHLDWLLLTKRPENYEKFLPADWGDGYPNVWLGISVENQERAAERIPLLTRVKAAVRFLSVEPMLDLIKINEIPDVNPTLIDWLIIGGESGPLTKIRKLNTLHVKIMMLEAKVYGIKIFFKQLGTILAKELGLQDFKGGDFDEFPADLQGLKIRQFPTKEL